jgi:hypothetical protein
VAAKLQVQSLDDQRFPERDFSEDVKLITLIVITLPKYHSRAASRGSITLIGHAPWKWPIQFCSCGFRILKSQEAK